MFLVKTNHGDRAGSTRAAVERIRRRALPQPPQQIMVEVRNEHELDEALGLTPDFILLDNMSSEELRRCVRRTGGRVPLQESGGITVEPLRPAAEGGVDR